MPENPKGDVGDCTGGDLTLDAGWLEKLRPPNASAKPPKASVLGAVGEAIPPKEPNEGCRSCAGCCAG